MAILPALPAYKAAGTSQDGTGALTVAWPAGHAVDDIAILVVSNKNQSIALTTPNGFTSITNNATTNTNTGLFWARATSSAMAAPVVTAASNGAYARIYTFSNCIRTGNPYNISHGGTAANSAAIAIGASTSTVQQTLVVGVCGYNFASATPQTSAWADAALGSVTNRGDESTAAHCGAALTTGTLAAGGSSSNLTATLANSCPHSCVVIQLAPRWTIDKASGVGFPSSLTEWTDIIADQGLLVNELTSTAASTPTGGHKLQEGSGTLVDYINTAFNYTATNASYGNSMSGFTRLGIATLDGQVSTVKTTSSSLPDLSSAVQANSIAVFIPAYITATVGGTDEDILELAGGTLRVSVTSASHPKITCGANTATGTKDCINGSGLAGGGSCGMYLVVNFTAGTCTLYTSQEVIRCALGTMSSTKSLELGGDTGIANAVSTVYGWDFFMTGAAAEYTDVTAWQIMHALNYPLGWAPGDAAIVGSGAVAGSGAALFAATYTDTGTDTDSYVGVGAGIGDVAITGSADVEGVAPTGGSVGTITGAEADSFVGGALAPATYTDTGAGAVAAAGASLAATIGTIVGSGAVAGVGASDAASVGTVTGTDTDSYVSASTAASPATIAGAADVEAVGTAGTPTTYADTGSADAEGAGASIAASTASIAGGADVEGAGASLAAAEYDDVGSADVEGVGSGGTTSSFDMSAEMDLVGVAPGGSLATACIQFTSCCDCPPRGHTLFTGAWSASGDAAITGIADVAPSGVAAAQRAAVIINDGWVGHSSLAAGGHSLADAGGALEMWSADLEAIGTGAVPTTGALTGAAAVAGGAFASSVGAAVIAGVATVVPADGLGVAAVVGGANVEGAATWAAGGAALIAGAAAVAPDGDRADGGTNAIAGAAAVSVPGASLVAGGGAITGRAVLAGAATWAAWAAPALVGVADVEVPPSALSAASGVLAGAAVVKGRITGRGRTSAALTGSGVVAATSP